jgi:hypothetical protein
MNANGRASNSFVASTQTKVYTSMTEHKPSHADAVHIALAEYQRQQKAFVDRIATLRAARLALENSAPLAAKRKRKAVKHSKTKNFSRWS